jgi:hypothetical protein
VATTEGHAAKNDPKLSDLVDLARPRARTAEEVAVKDLILKMAISIDGFVSDLDGRNTWMFGAVSQGQLRHGLGTVCGRLFIEPRPSKESRT